MAPWTESEVKALLVEYLNLLRNELAGIPLSKTAANARVVEMTGRSKGSVEYKFANVSAVLKELGYPYVQGYKPRSNFQASMKPLVRTAVVASGIQRVAH